MLLFCADTFGLYFGNTFLGRQRGRIGKGIVFKTTLIARAWFNRYPDQLVISTDKTLYDDYLCLVALKSGKFNGQKFKEFHWKLLSRCGFL